jgi:hypothetical protein
MLIKLIEVIGLAKLIKSTNQPFNPINDQSLGSEVLGSMLTKLIEFIGLAELIISTNQPFNSINHQSLTSDT